MQADGLGLPGYSNPARGMKDAAATHTYTQKTIFCPIPGPPPPSHSTALAKSWLAHNCTQEYVCVRLKAMPLCINLSCQLLLLLTYMFDIGTRLVTLCVFIRRKMIHAPSLLSAFLHYLCKSLLFRTS